MSLLNISSKSTFGEFFSLQGYNMSLPLGLYVELKVQVYFVYSNLVSTAVDMHSNLRARQFHVKSISKNYMFESMTTAFNSV